MVGQRPLKAFIEVRILVPQQKLKNRENDEIEHK